MCAVGGVLQVAEDGDIITLTMSNRLCSSVPLHIYLYFNMRLLEFISYWMF